MSLLRPFTIDDAAACCDVINAAVEGMDGLNDAARAMVRAKNVAATLGPELQAAHTLVAEENGQVCGVGCLAGDEIRRLYVRPTLQRRGVGLDLVEALEIEARRRGLEQIHVEASPSSVGFYRRVGFEPVREDAFTRGEATFRVVVMTKRLGRAK